MPRQALDVFYEPNLNLTQAHGLLGYNAGYAEVAGRDSFDQHQKDLVWKLLGDLPIGPDSTVVDVGCGIGGPTGWIFERYRPARLVGVEYCWSSVRAAERRWADASRRPYFIRGDAHSLPLAAASVDVIFNLESALHYRDKRQFLSECRRVLKPGGRLCLGDITTRRKTLFAGMRLLDRFNSQFSTHARLWATTDYLRTLESLGLRLLRHDEVSRQAARSLNDGLTAVSKVGWHGARGYRGRFFYLKAMEWLLRRHWLTYDLFAAAKV
jgi:ubiquinone/menaquinone biosynthesis C-methylase UbiE